MRERQGEWRGRIAGEKERDPQQGGNNKKSKNRTTQVT